MRLKIKLPLLIILLLVGVSNVFGQACSCGGAPLVGSFSGYSSGAGHWQIGLTYDYSSISDVVDGSTELPDNNRFRNVHSGLLEISFGISNRLSISTLIALLEQNRVSGSQEGAGESLKTRGIADGLILLKYNLMPFNGRLQRQVAIGGGLKIPFGKSGLTSNNLLIAADMQPGTGSWDGVVWGYIYQGLYGFLPIGLSSDIFYRMAGSNDRFGLNQQVYKFGNELNWSLEIGGTIWKPLSYTLGLNYRTVKPSQFAGLELPNSGGRWLDFKPGLNIKATESISFRVAGSVPLSRELEGTQLTTSYRLSISLFYIIKPNEAKKSQKNQIYF